MNTASTVEISAWLDKLRSNLAELGPVEKIKNPDVKAYAGMMQQMLMWVQRDMNTTQPNEEFQRRMIDAALLQWRDIVTARDIVPTLNARRTFSTARERQNEKLKKESARQDAKILAAAKELLAVKPKLND